MKNLNLIVAIFLLNFVNLSAQRTFTNQNTTAADSLAQSLQINGYQRIPSNLRVIVVELQLF
jgi:ribosomal protein L31E